MLDVRDLSKSYSGIPALSGVSFQVKPYEILGYLGPNGSGKTTTVSIITGLLRPTRGQVLLDGKPMESDVIGYKRRIGYVPETATIYTHLSGLEYLQMVGRLRTLEPATVDRRANELLQLFNLHEFRNATIGSYSKGMRQKVLISAAILHDPDLLIFDEPLSGLDVASALVFKHLVAKLAAQGKMVLYSSHVLEVVEKICTQVLILYQGTISAHDSVENLRNLMQAGSLEHVFTHLVIREDAEATAQNIVTAIQEG